jgi:hypothetical protein
MENVRYCSPILTKTVVFSVELPDTKFTKICSAILGLYMRLDEQADMAKLKDAFWKLFVMNAPQNGLFPLIFKEEIISAYSSFNPPYN